MEVEKNGTAPSFLPRLEYDAAVGAAEEWGFNCGPGALCGVLGCQPAQIRPYLANFENKGYTNPTLMRQILRNLGIETRHYYQALGRHRPPDGENRALYPPFGLVRIQWDGPWCKNAMPIRTRYRHTHWIGCYRTPRYGFWIFDVNAVCVGGWIPWDEWSASLVPWLLGECEPKASGDFWPTHSWSIDPGARKNIHGDQSLPWGGLRPWGEVSCERKTS